MKAKPKTRETELKLTFDRPQDAEEIVALLASSGYGTTPGARVRNEDLYLDTFEWSLLKKGMALRFRRSDGRPFYTLKSVGTVKDGVIEVQGDHAERLVPLLQAEGWRVKRAGG